MMADNLGLLDQLIGRVRCLSIFQRIAIGNSVIIIAGAVGGTLITRHLAIEAADLGLIALFAISGTAISVFLNSWLISNALRPLRALSQAASQVQSGTAEANSLIIQDSDPDICQLSSALHTLIEQLHRRNSQLRALSERVINAQEEERRRIALSLHDDTGQALSALILNLERIEKRLPSTEIEAIKKIQASHKLAGQALAELRKIIRDLRPTILDNLGLAPAIRWYARSNLEEAGIRVKLNVPDELEPLPQQMTSALFRISQEAIHNIVRHSGARSVEITLCQDKEQVRLTIQDDGIGFDISTVGAEALDRQQWGLLGIRERAELIGGDLFLDSGPGRGTRLEVCIPLTIAGGG